MKNDDVCYEDEEECLCPVEGIIAVVSKKWTICITSRLGRDDKGHRFNKLKRSLDGIRPSYIDISSIPYIFNSV